MTRATIDFYDEGPDAAENAASLCGVGLKPGDIAAIWSVGAHSAEAGSGASGAHLIETSEYGRLGVMGWLVQESPAGPPSSATDLSRMLRSAEPSEATLARVADTLRGGGGIVVVRAAGEMGAV